MRAKASHWPSRQQELLLRAAILQGQPALEAWRAWKADVELDLLEPGSQRLLPLLYQNLVAHGVQHPLLDRLRDRYRSTWVQNQTRFHFMSSLLRSFHEADISTMILKGVALALQHYRDLGLRPLGDIDLLVPTDQVVASIELLSRLGWTPKQLPARALTPAIQSIQHGRPFLDPNGRELDLHWHVLHECSYPGADDDFWAAALSTTIHRAPTRVLNPADQLLHVCVHGSKWEPVPVPWWVADAVAILRTPQGEIDWDRLANHAERRRLILPLGEALSYLRDVVEAPIPASAVQTIRKMPTSRVERMEYAALTNPPGLLGTLPATWVHYLRLARGASGGSLQPHFAGFLQYLQDSWGIEHVWQIPLRAISRAGHSIWATLIGHRLQASP
jgi:hypothetical protein